MPVYEIAPDQESLESFYLSLMNGTRDTSSNGPIAGQDRDQDSKSATKPD
jgi:hypothetical protein